MIMTETNRNFIIHYYSVWKNDPLIRIKPWRKIAFRKSHCNEPKLKQSIYSESIVFNSEINDGENYNFVNISSFQLL